MSGRFWPWFVECEKRFCGTTTSRVRDKTGIVAWVFGRSRRQEYARLIAAAPEMLEALKDALHELDYAYEGAPHFAALAKTRARAAIAKAGGKL